MKLAQHVRRIRGGAYDNSGDRLGFMTARAFLSWRAAGMPAARALELARASAAAGRESYAPFIAGQNIGAPGERGGRWIESPAAAGLRFVGFADEIAGRHYGGIDHTGWYLQPGGYDSEVARGAVYQLPARGGRPVYVEALRTGCTDNAGNWRDMSEADGALVFLGARHLGEPGGIGSSPGRRWLQDYADSPMQAAARGADREAELYAEKERDYQTAAAAGRRCAELESEAAGDRDRARQLIRELRNLSRFVGCDRFRPSDYGLAFETVRQAIKGALRSWRDSMRQAAELRESYDVRRVQGESVLYVGTDNPLRAAFLESYEESI